MMKRKEGLLVQYKNIEQMADWLEFTKVKTWAINFKIGNEYYLLHGQSELGEPDVVTLYVRERYEVDGVFKGFKNRPIVSYCDPEDVKHTFIRYKTPKATAHCQIDKKYFIKKLIYRGYIYGTFADEILADVVEKNRDKKVRLEAYENLAKELEDKIYAEKREIEFVREVK